MDIKITKNGENLNLNLDINNTITFIEGDKIMIDGYLKHFKPFYINGELYLNIPETNKQIIFENIDYVIGLNSEKSSVDFNNIEDIEKADLASDYSFIAFKTDLDLEDNVIDSMGSLFDLLESSEAGNEIINQNSFYTEEGKETIEVDSELVGRERLERPEDNRFSFIDNDSNSNSNQQVIPDNNLDNPDNGSNEEEDSNSENENSDTPDNDSNEEIIIDLDYVSNTNSNLIAVDIPMIEKINISTKMVLDLDLISEKNLYERDNIWYQETTKEVEEFFTNSRIELVNIEVPVQAYNTIGSNYSNLNKAGETTGIIEIGHKTEDLSIEIKSYKVSKDEGIVKLFNDNNLVDTIKIDDIYAGKDNSETLINISNIRFDSYEVIHTGEAFGNGKNSGEFKIGGAIENSTVDTKLIEIEEEVEFQDSKITLVEVEEKYNESVYKEIEEKTTVLIEDPDFDKEGLIFENGIWYEEKITTDIKAIVGNTEDSISLDLTTLDKVNELEFNNNVKIDLDDLLVNEEFYNEGIELEILIKNSDDGIEDNINISEKWEEIKNDYDYFSYHNTANDIMVNIQEGEEEMIL